VPARAVVLADGAILAWRQGRGWTADAGVLALTTEGALTALAPELAGTGAR